MSGNDIAASGDATATREVFQRVGVLTRQLHDALKELGHADGLRNTMSKLPDARSRLTYISRLSGEAAEKVLTRVEQAKGEQDAIARDAHCLGELLGPRVSPQITAILESLGAAAGRTDSHLTEIMMAQDFHDLTGQVIMRVADLGDRIEKQLVQLLLETAPATAAALPEDAPLGGPVVQPTADVVTNQGQVDDLLASLGF